MLPCSIFTNIHLTVTIWTIHQYVNLTITITGIIIIINADAAAAAHTVVFLVTVSYSLLAVYEGFTATCYFHLHHEEWERWPPIIPVLDTAVDRRPNSSLGHTEFRNTNNSEHSFNFNYELCLDAMLHQDLANKDSVLFILAQRVKSSVWPDETLSWIWYSPTRLQIKWL